MKFFRHRSLRSRFAIIAMLGLLWTQAAVAGHLFCSMASVTVPALVNLDTSWACHDETRPVDEAPAPNGLCTVHCSQGGLTKDVARVPAIPALLPFVPGGTDSPAPLKQRPVRPGQPPSWVSWHRPTAHPAALLLI